MLKSVFEHYGEERIYGEETIPASLRLDICRLNQKCSTKEVLLQTF